VGPFCYAALARGHKEGRRKLLPPSLGPSGSQGAADASQMKRDRVSVYEVRGLKGSTIRAETRKSN